jgi:ABC-type sugar transport system permease subunit
VSLFTEPFVLAGNLQGGANNQGMTVMMYLLGKAPKGNNIYGVASAVAYVICVIVVLISLLLQYLMGDREKKEAVKG